MKKLKTLLLSCFLIIGIISMNMNQSEAAGLSVSASSGSIAVGSSVTISVRVSGNVFVEGLSISCSGGKVTGLSKASLDRGETATATFTLTSASGGSVTVSGNAADYEKEIEYSVSGSCVIKVKTPSSNNSGSSKPSQSRPSQEPQEDPRSKNNNLKSLTINQGTLDPKFSANTTKYSVSLAADVTELSIEAKADDGKAKVSGTGKHTLKAGKNEIKVVCTSEYGTKKEYVIVAMVDEKPLVYLDYNGSQLGVVRNFDDVKAPDGFKETTVKVEDKETKAWVNEEINKTIIYLMNDANEKNFYVYEDGKVLTVLKPVTLSGLKLFIIDIEQSLQKRESMKYTEVEVDGQKLNGWIFSEKSFENYVLIYAMDSKGEMKYYQYEKTSQTLQPYSHAAPVTAEAYEKALNDANVQKYIFMGISGILAVIMVGGVIYYLKKVKKD